MNEQQDFFKKLGQQPDFPIYDDKTLSPSPETKPVDEDNGCPVDEEPPIIPEEHIPLTSEEETYEKPKSYVIPPKKPLPPKPTPAQDDEKSPFWWKND
jgi:hypothetical protein